MVVCLPNTGNILPDKAEKIPNSMANGWPITTIAHAGTI